METSEESWASSPLAKILIADDLPEWRARVREILRARSDWLIIGEASDGEEVIEKAAQMQPDVILLDVGMPLLNGIEAARVILQKLPKSKILFVTQDGDADIRNAAMELGASAYVLKANARGELLDAITKALER